MNDPELIKSLTPRAKKITEALDLSGIGIEYGPLHSALLSKSSFNVSYVDYADRDFLRAHYASDKAVDTDKIPDIDIVTHGKSISEFLPDSSIDYAVASHVMEHVPDILGWLDSNLRVLKPKGRLAVAFPDKRYCFDLKRKSSYLSNVIAAHLEQRIRPTFETLCDHFWNVAKVSAVDCWSGVTTPGNAEYMQARDRAFALLQSKVNSTVYTDAHCWVFTDQEFFETMSQVKPYVATQFEIVSFYPTQKNTLEFYATFERV